MSSPPRRIDPILSSSLEYEEYLREKLRRAKEGILNSYNNSNDGVGGRKTYTGISVDDINRTSKTRPLTRIDESYESEISEEMPIKHSWRMYAKSNDRDGSRSPNKSLRYSSNDREIPKYSASIIEAIQKSDVADSVCLSPKSKKSPMRLNKSDEYENNKNDEYENIIERKLIKNRLKRYFANWSKLKRTKHIEHHFQDKLRSKYFNMWLNNKKSVDSSLRSASIHHDAYQLHHAIHKLLINKKIARNKANRRMISRQSRQHYHYTLYRKIFLGWKYVSRAEKTEKIVSNEHNYRVERIKSLVNTLKTQKSNTSNAQQAVIQQQKTKIAESTSYQKKEILRKEKSEVVPRREKSEVVMKARASSNSKESEDDGEEEIQLPPPPAYTDAMKAKTIVGPRSTPPRTTTATTAANRTAPTASTVDYNAIDIETRSKLRRENLSKLKKEAEERVARRAEEEAKRRKNKQDNEDMEIDRLREEKRLQIEKAKQENLLEKEKMSVLTKKLEIAGKFYNKQLLVRVGMAPWIRLIELRRMNRVKAKSYYDDHLVQSTFMALYSHAMLEKNERSRREYKQTLYAATFYRKKLLGNIWKHW